MRWAAKVEPSQWRRGPRTSQEQIPEWAAMSTARGSLDLLPDQGCEPCICGGYSPGRWVWWNAAAKSRVLRLQALSRSLPLGNQSCLFCVSRTHPVRGRNCACLGRIAVCDGYRRAGFRRRC
jgi:hypothetical protein